MADSTNSYNLSDKIRQIQGNISTSNTLNGFLDTKQTSGYLNSKNSDNQNILKIMSDILISLVGSQENLKKMLVDLMTNNLSSIETKLKQFIKQYTLQLISCGTDARLNVPFGVVDLLTPQVPEQYPYIDQYDFYGLFNKDINDPIQKLNFDRNLNTFIKTNIDANNTTFTWKNLDNLDVIRFTYDEQQERIMVGPPAGVDWGPNGIGMKSFVDLYIDSINLFPTESILKELLDSIFDLKEGDPFDVDLDFLKKLLFNQCNCKKIEDDRSKSTFDLDYNDFKPETNNENDPTLMTNLKFGPVDAPIPATIIPQQPNLDESYLNTVTILSKDEFIKANRNNREQQISTIINQVGQDKHNQTTNINLPLNTKFSLKPGLEGDMNLKMILMLPVILAAPLFSPKISMYFGIIYKRYYVNDNPNPRDLWKTKDEYYQFLGKLIELIIKDIMKFLLKLLFEKIKKEIIRLIKKIITRVLSEKVMGYITQLKSLLDLYNSLKGKIPPRLPMINFDSCKSILDNLVKLFDIPNIPPGTMLPPGMAMMGMAKTGLSSTSMTQSAVQKMNDLGMDTKAMPDGSPNPNVVIASAMSSAVIEQIQNNARIQVSAVGVGYSEGGGTIT